MLGSADLVFSTAPTVNLETRGRRYECTPRCPAKINITFPPHIPSLTFHLYHKKNATKTYPQRTILPPSTSPRENIPTPTSKIQRPNNSRHKRRILGLRNLPPTQYPPHFPQPTLSHNSIAYYLPPSSLSLPLQKTPKSTYCEWKGVATYHSLTLGNETIKDRVWSYETPNKSYEAIRGYLSFYVGPWSCYVDGEEVKPQPGDFYGGWTTEELVGIIKGEGATRWL